MSESRLQKLMEFWQRCQDQGRPISLADLCEDCPELKPELERRIAQLRKSLAPSVPDSSELPELPDVAEKPEPSDKAVLSREIDWGDSLPTISTDALPMETRPNGEGRPPVPPRTMNQPRLAGPAKPSLTPGPPATEKEESDWGEGESNRRPNPSRPQSGPWIISDPQIPDLRQPGSADNLSSEETRAFSDPKLMGGSRGSIEQLPTMALPAGADIYATLAAAPSEAPFNPPNLRDYEIIGELGRGGMGVVYKARHLNLGRLVALKMLQGGGNARPEDLERFRTEAVAIARLNHPNIVQVFEIGECLLSEGGATVPYFSLEFCPGGSLDAKLKVNPLTPRTAAQLIEILARAIHEAHQAGVIHRDLKPGNVLLMSDGQPKITDFGLAKRLDKDDGKTLAGQLMGTPAYMAPEQASSDGQLGPFTDVYALGAILYECLTGRPPFRAATAFDTIYQVVNDDPIPPSRLAPKTPRELEAITLMCLRKEPARRYESAEALADDLRHFLNGEPIQARPVGLLERGLKWARRRPVVAGLSAALVAMVVIAFLAISIGWGLALNALAREDKAKDERAKTEVEALQDADPKAVPNILDRLKDDPALKEKTEKLL
jgi:hypothetical protein